MRTSPYRSPHICNCRSSVCRVLGRVLRVLNKDVHTFAYMVYMIALKLFRRDEYKSQWLKRVKYILDSCGLSYMWYQQQELSTKQCKVIIHQRIEDIALQKWNTDISTSSMCKMYRIF